MKTLTQSRSFPIEVGEQRIPGLILTLSVSAEKNALGMLEAIGIGGQEVHNMIRAKLDDAIAACDGSVEGLVVSNLEEL